MSGRVSYDVRFATHAQRTLRKLKKNQQLLKRIFKAIDELAIDPRPPGHKKLKRFKFDNLYRIRVGDWRILYAIEDDALIVLILDVVRRDQAYR